MTFKIKKVTGGHGKVIYYPMLRRSFWKKWYYINEHFIYKYIFETTLSRTRCGVDTGFYSEADANEVIDKYKIHYQLP